MAGVAKLGSGLHPDSSSSFPRVAGRDGMNLVGVLRELRGELDAAADAPGPSPEWLAGRHTSLWRELDREDERLVIELRRALAELAGAARGARWEPSGERAVVLALEGAEVVIREELAAARPEMIEAHLPGLAFMVVLPGLGRTAALALSRRVEELLDGGR
jgi:hypothetical protein